MSSSTLPRTVRIFISSTFRDMHSERDYLVKFVFPELRERCVNKGVINQQLTQLWGMVNEAIGKIENK